MIDRSKHVPLYIQLKDEISGKIKDGVWEIDSQIPTERELMEEYDLGRATVREAVSLLVNEGYLYKKQGIGTFVARRQPSIGMEPLISLTYPLEAMDIHPKNEIIKKCEITPDKHLLNSMKWKNERKCFYLERVRYAIDKPVAIEYSYFDPKFKTVENKYDLTGSLAKIIVKELKLTIRKVEQVIIPRMPDDDEIKRLSIDSNTQVFNLERWIYIEGYNEPFYYLRFIIPGDIINFAL